MTIDSISAPKFGEVRLEKYEWGLSERLDSNSAAGVVKGDLVIVVDGENKLSVLSLDEAIDIVDQEELFRNDPFGDRTVECHLCGEKMIESPTERTIAPQHEIPFAHDRCLDSFIDCVRELLDRNPEYITTEKI